MTSSTRLPALPPGAVENLTEDEALDLIAFRADEFDLAGAIPRSFLDDVVAPLGWWGGLIPAELGGLGLTTRELGRLHERVGAACSGTRSLLTVQTMVSFLIDRFGSPAQRRRWLPELASGRTLAAFCLSEEASSSDFSCVETRARLEPDGSWRLDGTKMWVTGGALADVYLVLARTPGSSIAGFLVPADAAGLKVVPIVDLIGTRASTIARLELDDVAVADDCVLGKDLFVPGLLPAVALDLGRFSVAAGAVGVIAGCLAASIRYARQRIVDGRPLADSQLTRQKLADMATALAASRALLDATADLRDEGSPGFSRSTWHAKYFSSQHAMEAASAAVQIHGAVGCTSTHPVARHLRDAKVLEIIEGSSEVQQLTIADFTIKEHTSDN